MLTKHEQHFLDNYTQRLQQSKRKFILIYGITWAFFVMLIMLPLEYLVFNKGSFSVSHLLKSILIWLVGGVVYGWWLRWYLERKHRSIQKKLTETGS